MVSSVALGLAALSCVALLPMLGRDVLLPKQQFGTLC
jgi:hypothetical protein